MQGYTSSGLTNTAKFIGAEICRTCQHASVCRFIKDALEAEEKLNEYLSSNNISSPIRFELKCDHKSSTLDITYTRQSNIGTSISTSTVGTSNIPETFVIDADGNPKVNNAFIETYK